MEGLPVIRINWKKFGLNHDFPEMFYTPQYSIPMPLYIFYKLTVFAYTVVVFAFQLAMPRTQSPLLFFTNWSYILQSTSLVVTTAICAWKAMENRCKRPDQIEIPQTFRSMHWYLKLRWVLHNIVATTPYLVSVVYWTFLWPHDKEKMEIPGYLHITIQVHGINSALAMLDQLMDRTPIKMHHFYHSLVFLTTYGIFTLIYSLKVTQPIYPFLDWNSSFGWATLCSVLVMVMSVCFHVIVIVIKKLQLKYSCNLTVNVTQEFLTEQTPLVQQYSLISG